MNHGLSAVTALLDRTRQRWLGIMSGTSGDGVDLAVVEIEERGGELLPRALRVEGRVEPFPDDVRDDLLRDLSEPTRLDAAAAAVWDARLGEVFARVAARAIADGLEADAIALSGHTFSHLPRSGATLQLGSAHRVAGETGLPVVSGFRAADVARGGEGAPLVPAGDRILFGESDGEVAVLNLGGISNLTWLPAAGGEPRARDCGPGNLVLDRIFRLSSDSGERFDRDGRIGCRGIAHRSAANGWMDHPFFSPDAPRSTGREEFGSEWVANHWRELEPLTVADRLATVAAWIASVVQRGIQLLGEGRPPDRLLVGGGGAHNRAVIAALARLGGAAPEPLRAGVHPVGADLREAAAFAILGHEWLRGRPGSFPGTTGCRHSGPLGALAVP